MKILELFSGSASFSNIAKTKGHKTITIDKDYNPDIKMNLLEITNKDVIMLKDMGLDIIWVSPPCTTFSVASISTHWKGGKNAYIPKTKEAEIGIKLIKLTWELIKIIKPKYWIIENPRGVLRKLNILPNEYLKTITYCQYGDNRMKPTDIWTNIPFVPKRCKNGMKCHISAPRGSKTGTQGLKNAYERSKVPKAFCEEILNIIEVKEKTQ